MRKIRYDQLISELKERFDDFLIYMSDRWEDNGT